VRVLTVYYEHRPGGMMKMIYRMLLAGAERGWEMHYLAVEPYRIEHPHLHAHLLPAPARHSSLLFWAWFFVAAPVATLALAWRQRTDLLAVFEGTYAWIALPASRLLRLPLVVFLQSDVATINRIHGRPSFLRRIEQWMEGSSLRHADRIIATNRALADLVCARWRLAAERVAVVPNNVGTPPRVSPEARRRLAAEARLPADAFVVATSGVFSPRKNVDLLLRAFAGVASPRAHLLVIGQGPDESAWRATVEAARAGANGERIRFLGWRSDVVEILAGCDLFVFPSRHEGSPLSLIEALRVGLACLGSDIDEIREVLGDDERCLFDPDDVTGLRQRLERATSDPGFYESLQTLARARAALYEFDWDAKVTALMNEPTLWADDADAASSPAGGG
jgi:glycosyltransferase involved in cell wall biosynthesis